MTPHANLFESAICNLVAELLGGPSDDCAFVLGSGDIGLLRLLNSISATTASQPGAGDSHSIAGHVHHVWFCLDVINRGADGDGSAFMTADWASSWNMQHVDDRNWSAMIDQLRTAGERWQKLVLEPRDWDAISMHGAIASVAHVAYHMAVIRQLAAFSRS